MSVVNLPVYDSAGKEVGEYSVDPAEIAPRISKQLLHDAVVMYLANKRQGTFATKTRAQVRGTTKKMYRQKGTGHARAGSRRSGVRRGGGHIFAKSPRDFSYRMPKKAIRLATRMAIASKIQDDQIKILDDLAFDSPKTKQVVGVLKSLKIEGATAIFATETHSSNIHLSARNIPGVEVSTAADLNALSVLRPRYLVITKAALDQVREKAKENGQSRKEQAVTVSQSE